MKKDKSINLDKEVLLKRESEYQNLRRKTFLRMYQKYLKTPLTVDFNNIGKEYDSKNLEILYNVNKAITQSLRTTTGTTFENCIENIFKKYKINYAKQVVIDTNGNIIEQTTKKCKCHKIDFMIPTPTYNTNIKNYNGKIISCKTTLRERYLQDKFLGKNIYLISLEKINDDIINCIQVNSKTKEFTNFIFQILKLQNTKK